jgi:hypothetical protein
MKKKKIPNDRRKKERRYKWSLLDIW